MLRHVALVGNDVSTAVKTANLTFLALVFNWRQIRPRDIERLEGIGPLKTAMISSGIEPATCPAVASILFPIFSRIMSKYSNFYFLVTTVFMSLNYKLTDLSYQPSERKSQYSPSGVVITIAFRKYRVPEKILISVWLFLLLY
jgi:hypothetical protein